MAVAARIRSVTGDPLAPQSLAARARRRRWRMFEQAFPALSEMRVLDLGGYVARWRDTPTRPLQVVALNLDHEEPPPEKWAHVVVGDACAPPVSLQREKFDLVFSNSLIEHVGGHYRCQQFASAVHSLAPHHWIQTPYRYFPVEAHWLFPGFQFLPVAIRAKLAYRWPLASERSSRPTAVGDVLSVESLSTTEMRYYFPESNIYYERFLGLIKSVIAVR